MKKLLVLASLFSMAFITSCNKANDEIETNPETYQKVDSDNILSNELENAFNQLTSNNFVLGTMVLDQPYVDLYVQGDPFTEPMPDPILGTDKKFKFNFWGIRNAVNYAGDIMQEGGCVKAWLDNENMINVEEIPC